MTRRAWNSTLPAPTKRIERKTKLAPVGATKRKKRARYDAYLKSPEWKAKRKACLERAGRRCEYTWKTLEAWFDDLDLRVGQEITQHDGRWRCTETTRLTAHHKHYQRFGNELPEDLICYCKTHHELVEATQFPHRRRA